MPRVYSELPVLQELGNSENKATAVRGRAALRMVQPARKSIDVPSCNSGGSPTKNPDVTAGHGPSMMPEPTWFRLVSGGIS